MGHFSKREMRDVAGKDLRSCI